MMKFAAISLIFAGSAAAFTAPSSSSSTTRATSSTAINAVDWDTTFGVTQETGNKCPTFGKLIEVDENGAKWWQNAEIKNGRVAMLATLGYVSGRPAFFFVVRRKMLRVQ